ncbi:MAG: MFS transporter [Actinomycetia bacterium]|nr:MFS transporter [Actinomycetes bacterium]
MNAEMIEANGGAGVDSRRGWLVVLATFISTATVFGITYSFSPFLTAMSDEFGTGNGATALLFGLTIFFLFGLSLPAGRASDLFGPRPVVLVGCAAMVIGLFLTSLVDRIWVGYLTYGGGIGIGAASGYVPLVAQVSGWFERQRAFAVGVSVSGIGVGTLVGPPIATRLIETNGWRSTFRVFAVVALVGLLLAALLVRRAPVAAATEPLDIRATFRSPIFRSMYFSGLLMTLALFVPFVFLKPYAEEHGISSAAAATLISFLGFGSLAGRLVLGIFVNRVGLLRLFQSCFVVLGGSFLIWLVGGGSYPMLALFAVVLGTSYGGYVALSPAATAELFGLSGLGAVLGALYTAGGIGGLVGPATAGWMIDATGGYTTSIVVALVLGLVSAEMLRRAINAVELDAEG